MKEIVINTKINGRFELSYKGMMYYAKAKKIKIYSFIDIGVLEYIPYNGEPLPADEYIYYCLKSNNKLRKKTEKGIIFDGRLKGEMFFYEIPRDDPALIKTVKELGKEVNAPYSNLMIVRIPDYMNWRVLEHDDKREVVTDVDAVFDFFADSDIKLG